MAAVPSSLLLQLGRWALSPEPPGKPGHLWPRWLFLRALGLIFFSAFYSLWFQINGLIGPEGILPAASYLHLLSRQFGVARYWYAPTLLWLDSGNGTLKLLVAAGLAASTLLFLNIWPRGTTAICLVSFLSFVSAAQDFSSYQSDGMLLAAGFLSLFFAPPGWLPGLGEGRPPSRASLFMLQWLWFTIYFESGLVKILGGDPEWRHLTALYNYYSNGPLPDWIGWYAQHLPHAFNTAVALATLVIELGIVWLLFLPRPFRIACFLIVTPFQIGIILTANLTFLNYFVFALGFLLLDDRFLRSVTNRLGWRKEWSENRMGRVLFRASSEPGPPKEPARGVWSYVSKATTGFLLAWVFYVDAVLLVLILLPRLPLPTGPVKALEPFRIANQYGLFAVMTRARYEIEFQGSRDGKTWIPYPFRYKPQNPHERPRIYAPYQPRFDWNLWFASLGDWRQYPFVVSTEELLLLNDPHVLRLFAGNPFADAPPLAVRAVTWQYWFTSLGTMRTQGLWWKRKLLGLYAPILERLPDGRIVMIR